ncbi:hypothetical protein ACXR0O_15145 [Verrucomicrobiota bacterium sgz303538]
MDSSLIDANASKNTVRRAGPELIDALRQVYRAQEAKLDTCNQALSAAAPAEEQEQAESEPSRERAKASAFKKMNLCRFLLRTDASVR